MAVDERKRHEVHESLKELLGAERAAHLMEMLPPVGWGDVATRKDLEGHAVAMKKDLEGHAVAMKKDLEVLEHKLRVEIHKVARSQLIVFVTIVGVMNGVVLAVLKLF